MKPGSIRWSWAEENKLKALCAAGYTYDAAAKELGRATTSVQGKARNMGLVFAKSQVVRRPVRVVEASFEPVRPPPPKYRSFTAAMFGDPPLGRSALDQKRGQV